MSGPAMSRLGARAVFASVALGIVCSGRVAAAEVEVGLLGGLHLFSPQSGAAVSRHPSSVTLGNGILLGARVGYVVTPRWGGELEFATASTSTADGASSVVASTARLGAVYNFLTGRVRPFAYLGVGAVAVSPSDVVRFDREVLPTGVLAFGLRYGIADWWGVRADGRMLALPGRGGADVAFDREWVLSFFARFPAPPAPEDVGPSAPLADEDHDGVADALDKCPEVPGVVRNYGCPMVHDADGDAIEDAEDRCPNAKGSRAHHGCPDSDRDGIYDDADKCPKEPETKNGYLDDDGCPDEAPKPPPPKPEPPPPTPPPAPVRVELPNFDRIDFEAGSPRATPAAKKSMDAIAAVLAPIFQADPTTRLTVLGHTDSLGNEAQNLQLSRQRAETVRAYLIAAGLDGARITAVGKGSAVPIVPNTSAANRQKNRRVELIVERDAK